jgi:NADH-quinone oxidoreductase subunit C
MRDIALIAAAAPGAEIKDGALVIEAEILVSSLEGIKNLGGFMLFDICSVDRLDFFEVSYRLLDMKEDAREVLTVRVMVAKAEPVVPSIKGVWCSADVLEREVWDLMGISFSGRGRLERILCKDDFIGHPLRKDFVAPERNRFPEGWEGRR